MPIALVLLFALGTPLVLIPVEQLLPYPYLLEEAVKAFLILFVTGNKNNHSPLKTTILIGLLFALSESFFYLMNTILLGNMKFFLQRLLITTPLHIFTCLLIFLPTLKSKKLLPLGLVGAITAHYLFNLTLSY